MKLGILADIHENVEMLARALDRLRRESVDTIVFLGDLFETGERLDEVGTRLAEAGVVGVWGNHEFGLCDQPSDAIRAKFAGPGLDFLATLQPCIEIDGCRFSHVLTHHDPTDIMQPWYTEAPPETADAARALFDAAPHRVMFGGHYHRWLALNEADGPHAWDGTTPLRLEPPMRWFVVIDAVCAGWCATYDTENHVLTPISLRHDEPSETPGSLLDGLHAPTSLDARQREAVLERIVSRYPTAEIQAALRGRMRYLAGAHGEAVLRLVESYGDDANFAELAEAVRDVGDELPPERAWEALSLLQGTPLLEAEPALAERFDELNDLLEESESSFAELADLLEGDSDGLRTALQALGAVEPEVRAGILAGLAEQPTGPGLVEFFRILAQSPEPTTARAAAEALASLNRSDPIVAEGLARLEPEPGAGEHSAPAGTSVLRARARLLGSRVTTLDGRGRGVIGLAVEDQGQAVAAAFLCDLSAGVLDVAGLIADDPHNALDFLREACVSRIGQRVAEAPEAAAGLLAACLTLQGPGTPPALPFWLERTVGAGFRPRPFAMEREAEDVPIQEVRTRTRDVLDIFPGWVDDSDLTYEIAEELLLREGGSEPDPIRDSGAFRFLFEGRIRERLELDRRMLVWMAAVWSATGDSERAASANALAWQLADAQHVVPGHPYVVELTRRSLAAAQDGLRKGIDLRDPATRERRARIEWP